MLEINISDGTGEKHGAEVTNENALKVATTDYDEWSPAAKFFQNDTYGINLNRNFSNEAAGNANEIIHNGTDTVEWTGSAIIGTWDVAATNNPDTGTKNIEQAGASTGDTLQLDRGGDVTMSAHTGFTGRIYLSGIGHILAELDFYAWDTGAGTIVGNAVNVYDYIDVLVIGTYQTFTIPLADMGLTGATFDAVRFQVTVKDGAVIDLDNIVLNDPTGSAAIGTTVFELFPDKGAKLYLDGMIINMADAYAGTVADGTMNSLRYDGFLALSALASPMVLRVLDNENVTFVAPFIQLIDFMQFGSPDVRMAGSDGTNAWFTLYIGLPTPIRLNAPLNQKMTLTLSSDLSGLLFFRFSANCRQRDFT